MNTKYLLFAFTFLAACSAAPEDPNARLASLKEQRAKIESQIADLETQLAPDKEQRIRTIAVTELQPTLFAHSIDLQGYIEADKSVLATSRMPGTLIKIYVDNGDRVREGQLLASLDDAVLQKNLAELQGQLDLAKDLFERQKLLWEQKVGSEVQYIQARNNVESLERSMATLNENISMTRISAPISGIVDMVLLKEGQAIAPGTPLCSILYLDKLKVKGDITESYISKVKEGDDVVVYLPDTKQEINTKISYVSRAINPQSRTFSVECKLNGKEDLRANQIAVLRITDYRNPEAIVIPVNLIQRGEDGEYVYAIEHVATGNEAQVRKIPITQGQMYNGYVEITSGLQPGDRVISTGFQEVTTGETVRF